MPSPPATGDSYEAPESQGALCEMLARETRLSPEKLTRADSGSMAGPSSQHHQSAGTSSSAGGKSGSSGGRSGLARARAHVTEADVSEALEHIDEDMEPMHHPACSSEQSRAPLSSRLDQSLMAAAAGGSASRGKRAAGQAQASPTTKRHRPRRGAGALPASSAAGPSSSSGAAASSALSSAAPPSEPVPSAAPGPALLASPSPQRGGRTEESWTRTTEKRRAVVEGHKRRADYRAYRNAVPLESREEGAPRTPDTELRSSKRAWETEIQKWREGLRAWYVAHGDAESGADEIDEISDPE